MNPAEEYILKQPEPFKSIFLHLQILIEHTFTDAEMKYKWRIPVYYSDNRPICYLNQSKDYVDVGFWHSAHLTRHTELMITENRKVVKSLRYKILEDINDDVLVDVLKEIETFKNKSFLK